MLLVKAQGLHFDSLKMRKICHLVSSSYVFFFFTCLFEHPPRLQVICSGRYTGYQRQTKGRNAANLVQNPSTRQRHGIIALRHLAPVPPRYPRTQHTVRIQNRTSQADESCIGHGNKQEPTPEHSLTLALWHSRSYRPKLALPIRASLPLSLGIAFIRLTADTSLLALFQSTLSPVPREHSMRVLRMVCTGTHTCPLGQSSTRSEVIALGPVSCTISTKGKSEK